jgi:hypothetical protein
LARTEVVVRAPDDGYTLLLATGANATNAALYEKLNFDFIRDIAPVASIIRDTYVMAVNQTLRFQPRRFLSSSPMPRAIPAELIYGRETFPNEGPKRLV